MKAAPVALAALAVLAALAAFAAPAPAAAPGDTATLDVAFIETLQPTVAKSAEVTIRFCAASSGLVGGARQVTLRAEDAPAWLDVAFEPASYTFAVPLPGSCDTGKGLARFNASRSAPGFEVVSVPLVAVDATDGAEYGRADFVFRVGYVGGIRVAPTEVGVVAPVGETVPFELLVENGANADTTFMLQVAGSRDDVQVVIPTPLRLAPRETGRWTAHALVPAGTGLDARTIELLVTSHATLDHAVPGASAVVTLDVEPRAGPEQRFGLPAPGALAAAAALAALALLARRR